MWSKLTNRHESRQQFETKAHHRDSQVSSCTWTAEHAADSQRFPVRKPAPTGQPTQKEPSAPYTLFLRVPSGETTPNTAGPHLSTAQHSTPLQPLP
eukprot:1157325-Pelagomonas_calceolata.AAC.17